MKLRQEQVERRRRTIGLALESLAAVQKSCEDFASVSEDGTQSAALQETLQAVIAEESHQLEGALAQQRQAEQVLQDIIQAGISDPARRFSFSDGVDISSELISNEYKDGDITVWNKLAVKVQDDLILKRCMRKWREVGTRACSRVSSVRTSHISGKHHLVTGGNRRRHSWAGRRMDLSPLADQNDDVVTAEPCLQVVRRSIVPEAPEAPEALENKRCAGSLKDEDDVAAGPSHVQGGRATIQTALQLPSSWVRRSPEPAPREPAPPEPSGPWEPSPPPTLRWLTNSWPSNSGALPEYLTTRSSTSLTNDALILPPVESAFHKVFTDMSPSLTFQQLANNVSVDAAGILLPPISQMLWNAKVLSRPSQAHLEALKPGTMPARPDSNAYFQRRLDELTEKSEPRGSLLLEKPSERNHSAQFAVSNLRSGPEAHSHAWATNEQNKLSLSAVRASSPLFAPVDLDVNVVWQECAKEVRKARDAACALISPAQNRGMVCLDPGRLPSRSVTLRGEAPSRISTRSRSRHRGR